MSSNKISQEKYSIQLLVECRRPSIVAKKHQQAEENEKSKKRIMGQSGVLVNCLRICVVYAIIQTVSGNSNDYEISCKDENGKNVDW